MTEPRWITQKLCLLGEDAKTPDPQLGLLQPVSVHLTIDGRPTTKKTKNQVAMVGGRPRVFPSKIWRKWVNESSVHIYSKLPLFPLKEPLNCRAIFYRERNAGDPVGYYQALADFLETCLLCRRRKCSCDEPIRILADDKWIAHWDGTRLDKDKDNPRVEVYLASAM